MPLNENEGQGRNNKSKNENPMFKCPAMKNEIR